MIEECLDLAEVKENETSVAYFYCKDHQDGHQNKLPSAARSMLAQLLQQHADILPYLYDECLKSAKVTLASPKECARLLGNVLHAIRRTYVVIDGIDECEQKERKAIFNFFASTISNNKPGKVRGFFVSQELNDIQTALQSPEILCLSEEHNKHDIRNYSLERSNDIQRKIKGIQDEAKDQIVHLVCNGSDGMFLFAKLVLDKTWKKCTKRFNLTHSLMVSTKRTYVGTCFCSSLTRVITNVLLSESSKIQTWHNKELHGTCWDGLHARSDR
jgi:hypothetical protein